MRSAISTILIVFILIQAAAAQTGEGETAPTARIKGLPEVRIDHSSVSFQAGLYPEYYRSHSAVRDMRWVQSNDSTLISFWQTKGDSILLLLSQLSGLNWVEPTINMYLVRFYPSVGNSVPLVIPLGGMRRGILVEAPPEGNRLQLNLIYQLAHRMLCQAEQSGDPMTNHPLMQPGAYRRDNLAMLLALVTAQQVIGLDSTYDAYQSAFWKQRTAGREILEQYMLSEWILTADHPLARWVVDEPYGSALVRATRPPRKQQKDISPVRRVYVEGLPLKGHLGFSVKIGNAGQLVIDKIDVTRLGYACGLREGDAIRSVDGSRVRTHKKLIEKILDGLDQGGATVEFVRDELTQTALIMPPELYNDDYYYWEGEYGDSLAPTVPPTEDTLTPAPE